MNHLSRLLAILTILKSKKLVTGSELAKKFEVSVRTIYRDIKKLEGSGVPIISIEGKGYSILEGYNIAPIMFDEKEVSALITAEKLISKSNDQSLIKNFEDALVKIKSVIKSSLKSKGEFLENKIHVLGNRQSALKSNSLSAIQMAVINFKVVDLIYEKENKESSSRLIEPVALFSENEKWIVIAWCRLRKDYRWFRLDRIKHFKVLNHTFVDRKFDLRKYFNSCPEMNLYL